VPSLSVAREGSVSVSVGVACGLTRFSGRVVRCLGGNGGRRLFIFGQRARFTDGLTSRLTLLSVSAHGTSSHASPFAHDPLTPAACGVPPDAAGHPRNSSGVGVRQGELSDVGIQGSCRGTQLDVRPYARLRRVKDRLLTDLPRSQCWKGSQGWKFRSCGSRVTNILTSHAFRTHTPPQPAISSLWGFGACEGRAGSVAL